MKAIIISCGTEIVTGQSVDTNSAWLSERLTLLGIEVVAHVSVGDDLEWLTESIRRAHEESDLVIITGGLGPTRDDLTREALATAIHRSLRENREALAQIERFFRRWQREMPESNKVQALIPDGCDIITNLRGTAPGIAFWNVNTAGNADAAASPLKKEEFSGVVALPGVPGEMKPMFETYVEPRLRATSSACVITRRLLCFGISEARLGETIADLMERGRNPLVGTTASGAILTIRILARGADAKSAEKMLAADCVEIRRRVGSVLFGEEDETLQGCVAKLLNGKKATVATVESCTGGLLAKMLTDVSGSSIYFLEGFVTYSNESKTRRLSVPREVVERHGAVSEEVARLLAQNARGLAGSDYALSTTGIAGPGGGSSEKPVGLVYIGLADGRGAEVRRLLIGDHLSREEIRDRACKHGLNMLRLRLLE